MRDQWEVEYRGEKYLIRRRARARRLAGVVIAVVISAGAVSRAWTRVDASLRQTAHVTAAVILGSAALVFGVLLWRRVRSGPR